MLKHKKPVLDEREMLEMYQAEHFGLWFMYGLLCASILVQMFMGAAIAQMAGEMIVLVVSSVAMVIVHVRRGVWDTDSRPSIRGNAGYSVGAGVCVTVLQMALRGNLLASLITGICTALLVFAVLTVLMQYMMRRQAQQEKELESD
ncbi:MAG: hypothetical protein IKJ11_00830 [Clostridia bacterium]|nr:hypothetical protein [Clostridia bacterium]